MTKKPFTAQYRIVSESDWPAGTGLDGFAEVYEREFTYVWRTLGRLGVPIADLPDAVHDAFVVLFRRWHEVDPDRPLRPWIFGVARRIAAAARRRRRQLPVADLEPPVVADERIAQRDLLWRALAQLGEARRVVVVLHDLEGYTGADIARMLGLRVNTVYSRLRLARAELVTAIRRLQGLR